MMLSDFSIWQELLIIIGAMVLIYIARVFPLKEKKTKAPKKTVIATVVSKEVKSGTYQTGRSNGGYSYAIKFITEEGQELELFAYEVEFGGVKEGTKGKLTYKGPYFISFEVGR